MEFQLVICLIGAIICAVLARHKGRSVVGWFFIGFFFTLIGLIIILVISNKREEREKEEQIRLENKRLQEQLRQERLKNEVFRSHTQARLDTHDQALQLDTRQTAPALASGEDVFPRLPGEKSAELAEPAQLAPSLRNRAWFYYSNEKVVGPYSLEQLGTFVREGSLDVLTAVCPEGENNWTPLREVLQINSGENS